MFQLFYIICSCAVCIVCHLSSEYIVVQIAVTHTTNAACHMSIELYHASTTFLCQGSYIQYVVSVQKDVDTFLSEFGKE